MTNLRPVGFFKKTQSSEMRQISPNLKLSIADSLTDPLTGDAIDAIGDAIDAKPNHCTPR